MATTTADAICARMIEEIQDLTPATLGTYGYKLHRDHERTVREQGRAQPDVVRLFTVRDTGIVDGPLTTNGDVEWVWVVLEMVMAYPKFSSSRWGADAGRDLDAVMVADRQQIEGRIGPVGWHRLADEPPDAVVIGGEGWPQRFIESEDKVAFCVLRLRVGFYRDMNADESASPGG